MEEIWNSCRLQNDVDRRVSLVPMVRRGVRNTHIVTFHKVHARGADCLRALTVGSFSK